MTIASNESRRGKTYGFWDGDFTFHVPVYDGLRSSSIFRVRIDTTPQQRALDNVNNHNRQRAGWDRYEITSWLNAFRARFPRRTKLQTTMLRHLRLHGPTRIDDVADDAMLRALLSLIYYRGTERNFQPRMVQFAKEANGIIRLTPDGVWLTSLMK
jgi:hypothetical protein